MADSVLLKQDSAREPVHAVGKTLVLVASIPGGRNVGEILVREMLECFDPDRFVIAALLGGSDRPPSGDAKYPVRMFERPNEHASRPYRGRAGSLFAAIDRLRCYERAIPALADSVAKFAAENQVTQVWAIFNMTTVIDVCAQLIRRTRLPLLAHVWDDVEHVCLQRRLDSITCRRTKRRFAGLLAYAERTAVIGESMGEAYTAKYGARCQIIRHGVGDAATVNDEPTSKSEFVIGFSGGMYSLSAWKALQKALESVNWSVAQKNVRLVVMGEQITLSSRSPANVEFLGWRTEHEVHARLAACDLLYLPQPFEPHQRAIAELSFPTKLSAYVSTGRPVLMHGPDYASLNAFSKAHSAGIVCNSLDPTVIAKVISDLASDPTAYRAAAQSSTHVASRVLSRTHFAAQVRSFLGAPLPLAFAT